MKRVSNCIGWLSAALPLFLIEGCGGSIKHQESIPPQIAETRETAANLHSEKKNVPTLTLRNAVRVEHKPLMDSKSSSFISPSIAFSSDNCYIITHSSDVARFWRLSDYQEAFHVPKSSCRSLFFSPDGRSVFFASDKHTLCIRDITDGRIIQILPSLSEEIVDFSCFSLGGKTYLLLVLTNQFIFTPIYNPYSLLSIFLASNEYYSKKRAIVVPLDELLHGSLNPSGLNVTREQERFDLSSTPVVHPSGRAVLKTRSTPSTHQSLCCIDLKSGREDRQLANNAEKTFRIRFCEDGALFGTCESTLGEINGEWFDKWFRIFNYSSGKEVWAWNDMTTSRFCLVDIAFSPDHLTFATADPLLIRLWDLHTGQEVLRLEHDESNYICSLAISPDGKLLAAATPNGRVWIWRIAPPSEFSPPHSLDFPAIDSLWTKLARTNDAPSAYRAIWTLAASPKTVAQFLADRLAPVPSYSPERIRQLILKLDDDSFQRREAATRDLSALGMQAAPFLRNCLSTPSSPEVRRRAQSLLESLKPLESWIVADPTLLRRLRAIRVLQCMGTPEARSLLEKIAAGAPDSRQTQEAKSALQYLNRIKKR